MKNYMAATLSAFLLCFSASLHAHHSHASLNRDDVHQFSGVVVDYSWRMPHVSLKIRAPNESGEAVNWVVELLHPAGMQSLGWTADDFKPGDPVVWEGYRDFNPNRYYMGLHWVDRADGSRLYNLGAAPENAEPEIIPSTDFSGWWLKDTTRMGFSYFPPVGWPLTDFAQARVDAFAENQNPQLDCYDPGPPKSTFLPYPMRIQWLDKDTLVMDYDMREQRRVVHMNQEITLGAPSKLGQSRGWMEGDELVVESTNFIADRWGIATGIDSSEQKHLIERFSLENGGLVLHIQMTITDPVYLTEPYVYDYYMNKTEDHDLQPVSCTVESARLYIDAGYQ